MRIQMLRLSGAKPAQEATARRRTPRNALSRLFPWVLVALSPVIFAASTWSDAQASSLFQAAIRLFGLPILAIEIWIILIAFARGWTPFRDTGQWKLSTRFLLTALIIVALATAASARNAQASFIWTYISLVHLLFAFAVADLAAQATSPETRTIWPMIVFGLCLFGIMLDAFVSSAHSSSFDWRYLGFAVTNVRQLGFYSDVGTAAALGLAFEQRGRRTIVWVAAGAFLFSIGIWSGGRGALFAVPAGLLAAIALRPVLRSLRTCAIAVLTLVLGGVAAFLQHVPSNGHYGFGRIAHSLGGHSLDELGSGRIAIWHDTWQAFLQHPLFGYGEAQLSWIVPLAARYLHPHNIIVQLLFQWGLIGTAITAALIAIMTNSLRSAIKLAPATSTPAMLVVITIAIHALYDGALFHTYPLMMFAFANAVLIGGAAGRLQANGTTAIPSASASETEFVAA